MIASIFMVLEISIALNAFFFVLTFILKKNVFTDMTYALTFLVTTIIIMIINSSSKVSQYLVLSLVILWTLRLGTFLFIRIYKTTVDHRFDKIRNSFWKFGMFWFFQAIIVWIVNMPTYITIINPSHGFNNISIMFFLGTIFFLGFEMIADIQKYKFTHKNPHQFINTGLWKISRHPNYFGEMSFWIMLTTFVLINNFKYINLIALVEPLHIVFILYKISGVPILEKQGMKLFGKDSQYIIYLNKTPCVIPFIGKKGYKKSYLK